MRNFANYDVDIHGKSSGVLKTICKKCLPTRKNKRDRSLRVNVDTGHCHCYHCGADFYVPDDVEERKNAERAVARKRRAAAIPQHFQRPMFDVSKTTLSEDTERWLVETRCIPQSVIAALRITEQEEFMPQSGKKERCICFNYFEGEQLINTKFRALPKLFKMVQGAELIPYNIDSILGQTSCIIHEGELDAASSIAAGFKSAISVPAGANSNLSWIDRFMETHFEDLEEIIIAVDADSAGIRLRNELINRLGAERNLSPLSPASHKDKFTRPHSSSTVRLKRRNIFRRRATATANQLCPRRQPLRQIPFKRRAGFTVMMPGLGHRIVVLTGIRINHQRQRGLAM